MLFIGNVTSQINNSYFFVSYFQSEEFFPNNEYFIAISSTPKDDNELINILNDTLNRIYYDIDYFILQEKDKIDRLENLIDSIQKDTSLIFYSSKEHNLKIYLLGTKQELEKYYWNQRSPTAIPLFYMDKNRLERTFTWVKGRNVLKNIPDI